MLACGIDFVTELNAFRLVSILLILMYPFIFMKYLKVGHYRSTCLDYSELLAYFALIMMLISKYGSVDQAFGTMPITMMVFLIQIPSYATTRVAMFHVYVVEIPLCALA